MILSNQEIVGKETHIFPNGIILIVNVIARLELEIGYYDVADQHIMLYSHLHIHAASQRHNDKDAGSFFTNIYTSHFIARVRKGCSRFACSRFAGDRT